MPAERLLASLWLRSLSSVKQPEGFLEDALAAALELTDAWPRLVTHFGWNVPAGPYSLSAQDRVEAGRTDLRLHFRAGGEVVLELKAGPAPSAAQVAKYADPGVQVIGLATTARTYAHPQVVGSTTWADLARMPWRDPPLPWRQLLHLLHAMDFAVPPINASALLGLAASYQAQNSVQTWAEQATDLVAARLTGDGARFIVKNGARGRRYRERAHQRQVAWAWPVPWGDHRYSGVWVGLHMGRPERPLLVSGLPDMVLCWQSNPNQPLHRSIAEDADMKAAIDRWRQRNGDTTARETDAGWPQILARSSTSRLLDQPEPSKTFLTWVSSILDEWDADGVTVALRRHLIPASAVPSVGDVFDPSATQDQENPATDAESET